MEVYRAVRNNIIGKKSILSKEEMRRVRWIAHDWATSILSTCSASGSALLISVIVAVTGCSGSPWAVGGVGGAMLRGKCGRGDASIFGFKRPASSCGLKPGGKWGCWFPLKPEKPVKGPFGAKLGSEKGGMRDINGVCIGFFIWKLLAFSSSPFDSDPLGSVFTSDIPPARSVVCPSSSDLSFSDAFPSELFSSNVRSSKSFGPRMPALSPCLAISSLWCLS